MKWYYLSFAGDEGFRGACVVQADDFISAVQETHRRKINPGGQVMGDEFPACETLPSEDYRNRLLSRNDILKIWPDAVTLNGETPSDN